MRKMRFLSAVMALMLALTGCSEDDDSSRRNRRNRDKDEDVTESVVQEETTEDDVTKAVEEYEISPMTEPEKSYEISPMESEPEETVTEEAEPEKPAEFEKYGASNIVNSGICVSDGERFYYCDTNVKKLFERDGGENRLIAENFNSYYMNLDGNMIYYADADNDNFITSYNLDSGEKNVICKMHAQELTLYNGMLYFSSAGDESKTIYRVNTDGSGHEALVSCEDLWYMNVYKDKIYFVNYENKAYAVVSMNIDGSELEVIRNYNASDLCVAEDKIFFSERDTRYLYVMNLDGSDVQQLNSTYSRCLNYMNGQLYYFTDEDRNHTMYSCDTEGNVTGRYESDVKFLMLMNNEVYYYDWDLNVHIASLGEKSDEDNYHYGTDITSYKQEEILKTVREHVSSNWSGYYVDEEDIKKSDSRWTLNLCKNGSGEAEYMLVIHLSTGRVTVIRLNMDELPTSVYLFDAQSSTTELSEDKMKAIADKWVAENCEIAPLASSWEYHDYDKNGTYEAYAAFGKSSSGKLYVLLFISAEGKVTVVYECESYIDIEYESYVSMSLDDENYIEYEGRGYFLAQISNGAESANWMYGVKDNDAFDYNPGVQHISLSDDGYLHWNSPSPLDCKNCVGDTGCMTHSHILDYDESTGTFIISVLNSQGEIEPVLQ